MAAAVAVRTRVPGGCVRSFTSGQPKKPHHAKANLFRGVLAGQLSPAMLADDEFKRVADLCVNCHQCRLECPAGVDIPKLMIEAKAAYVSTNGLRRATGSWPGSICSAPGGAASVRWPIGPFAIDRLAGCWRNAWA